MAALMMPLEMDGEELAKRIQSQGPKRLDELSQKPIFIEDRHFDIESVCSSIRMAYRRKHVRFVIIDYLTLIEVEGRENSAEKTAKITRRLKRLAKELKIPIVVLAQLNRDLEKRDNKRPQLSDLRSSGSIEQDADVVMFLYRHEVYHPGEKEGECEVIVAKQRNGPTGTVRIGYLKEQTRFVSADKLPVDTSGFFEGR
jgi:replicative DNA helicase